MEDLTFPIIKTNLYEQIADGLERIIMDAGGTLEKLPSENELARHFEVSRTVIREALKVLKERGLVTLRNGERAYVSKPKADTVSSAIDRIVHMDNIGNDDLHGVRNILELAAVRLAAERAEADDIEELKAILQAMADGTLPLEDRIGLDARFHLAIAGASKNELLRMCVDVMDLLIRKYMSKGIFDDESIRLTMEEHGRIVGRIEARDPVGAELAMRDHLEASRAQVAGYEKAKSLRHGFPEGADSSRTDRPST